MRLQQYAAHVLEAELQRVRSHLHQARTEISNHETRLANEHTNRTQLETAERELVMELEDGGAEVPANPFADGGINFNETAYVSRHNQ